MSENENKLKIFKNEIEDIKDDSLREFAKEMVTNFPNYFFTCPASSTGKYHPTLSLGEGGLVRHTRLVVWFAEQIANAMMIDEHEKDLLIVSGLTHDSKKHGDGNIKYTVKEHPKLASELLDDVWNKTNNSVSSDEIEKIKSLVESHMGQWGEQDGMPLPSTNLQWILHTADYLASRKEITGFSFRPTEETEKIEEPASEYRIVFGKYQGKTIGQIMNEDQENAIDYFAWVISNENFKMVEAKEKMKKFIDSSEKPIQESFKKKIKQLSESKNNGKEN